MSNIQLFNQDCMTAMASMKDKEFELAIVDPPYGIGLDFQFKCGYGESIHKKKEWNNCIPPPEYFEELYRVSKNQIIWGCNYYPGLITAVGRIVHDKLMDLKDSKIGFSEADLASCSMQRRIRVFRYRWSGNLQGNKVNYKNEDGKGFERRVHPTQKPVALYQWLLKNYAKPGDRILDTHLGSGSSAIAADIMGFDFVGYEIDEDYYKAALDRFNRHKQQCVLEFAK
jgi:site-specific DNA-methyltransferase (adenine-specific)